MGLSLKFLKGNNHSMVKDAGVGESEVIHELSMRASAYEEMKGAADLEDGSRKANKGTITEMRDTKDTYSAQCELKTTE